MGLTMRSLAVNVFLVGLVISAEFNDSEVSNFSIGGTNCSSFALDFSTVLNSSLDRNESSFQAVPEDTTTTKESVPGSTKVTTTTEMDRTFEHSSFLSEIETGNSTNTNSPLGGESFAEIDNGNETKNGSSPVLSFGDFRKNSMSPKHHKDDKHHYRDHDHRDHEHGSRDRHAAFFVESDNSTNASSHNPESVNTDVDSLRSAKAAENETSANPSINEFMELQENGTFHTGLFNISSSLTQPSETDDIEDKAVSELSTDPPARDFWGFKNTFSKLHPWVGWFVGVPSSTDSNIDISKTDATTEFPREKKLLINSDYGHNLVDLSLVDLNDSESVELGNSTENSSRDISDGRSLRSDVRNDTIFVALENGTDHPNRDVEYGRSLSSINHEDWVVNNSSDHVHNESCGVEFNLEGFNASFVDLNFTEDVRHQRSFPNISHEDWMVTNASDHVHNESYGLELDLEGINDGFFDLRANITAEREIRSMNLTTDAWMVSHATFDSLDNSTDNERDMRSLKNFTYENSMINGTSFLDESLSDVTKVANRPWSGVGNLFSVNGTEYPLDFMVINIGDTTDQTDTRKERQLDLNETNTGNSVNGRAAEETVIMTSSSLDVEETSTNSLTARTAAFVSDEASDVDNTVTTDSSLDARTGFVFDKNSIAKLVDESFDKLSLTDFLHKFPTHKPLTLNDILDKVPTRKPLVISKHELSNIIHKPLDKPSLDRLLHKDKPKHDDHHDHDHHNDHDHLKPSKHSTAKPPSSSFKPDHHHGHDHHHKSSTTSKPTIKPTTTSTTTMKPTTTTTPSTTTMKPTTTTTPSTTTMKPTTTTTPSTTTMKPTTTTTSTTTMKPTTTTSTTTMKPTTTYKPKTSTYKSYPPQPYSYHPDEIAIIGVVDAHQEAGMSPPVFARPHEHRYAPDNYQEVPASNNYELVVSGYSAPVFAKPVEEKLKYECPSYLARHPCPIWLMEKDPHCDTHVDCQKEYPMSMCCLYNCRRRCVGNVHPYEVQKQRVI